MNTVDNDLRATGEEEGVEDQGSDTPKEEGELNYKEELENTKKILEKKNKQLGHILKVKPFVFHKLDVSIAENRLPIPVLREGCRDLCLSQFRKFFGCIFVAVI